jgi:DNA-binding XRE family transcriptional regulator
MKIALKKATNMNNVLLMKKRLSPDAELAHENYGSWIDFHQSLVQTRMSMGLTQRAVGEKSGISQPAIAQFEKVTYTPTVDSILTYAQALGVKVKFSIAAS